MHIACGVKTNVVSAVAIYGRDANDCPILPELLKSTAERFKVLEMSADKGYLSAENVEAIFAAGATPYIALKSNTTGGVGGLFAKMVETYNANKYLYMDHYHKRSNVESTFSMIKRKFGDSVRARTDTAMTNEVLCKILCHNLCVVHHSHVELGIEPVFWAKDEPEKEAKREEMVDILPFARPG